MEQELRRGAKAKSPFSGNHYSRKDTLAQESSRFLPLREGRESVGLRKEISHGPGAEEARGTCRFQMASAGAPGALASEALSYPRAASGVVPSQGRSGLPGLTHPAASRPCPPCRRQPCPHRALVSSERVWQRNSVCPGRKYSVF